MTHDAPPTRYSDSRRSTRRFAWVLAAPIAGLALLGGACAPTDDEPAAPAPPKDDRPLTVSTGAWSPPEVGAGSPVEVPPADPDRATLDERAAVERARWEDAGVEPPRFRFEDRREESQITFRNYVVDDIKRDLKPVHYDHGNGVAAADVDGDGIVDLHFTNQLGDNELWRGLGDGRFENISERAGIALGDRVSVAGSFGDVDNDGDPDLYVTTVDMGNVLFINDGSGVFSDRTEATGLGLRAHSSGSLFFDYDLDGWLDLFVANVGRYTTTTQGDGGYFVGLLDAFSGHLYPEREEASRLYRNRGDGTFEDVTESTGLVDKSWTGDATTLDVNGDRYPDLYVLDMQGHDELWINRGGETFEPAGAELFEKTPWGAMGIKSFDYDNDGDFDLLLTDMHSDMSHEIGFAEEGKKSEMRWDETLLRSGGRSLYGNAFYRNDGGTFTEISDSVGVEHYWPWGFSVADLDADGFQDVFVAASMSYPYRYMPNLVLMNQGGERFEDAVFSLGVEPRADGATYIDWFDLDCAGADAVHTVCRDRSEKITVRGTLGTRSSVILDLDSDGDLDIVTHEFGHYPQVLVSDLSARSDIRYLAVRLVGEESNRDGLGAQVTVSTGDRRYTMVNDGKSGYLSQSLLPLYFGLAGAERVDVHVTWPSGAETRLEDIQANQTLEVLEAGS